MAGEAPGLTQLRELMASLKDTLPWHLAAEGKGADRLVRAYDRYSRGAFKATHPAPAHRDEEGALIVAAVNALPRLLAVVECVRGMDLFRGDLKTGGGLRGMALALRDHDVTLAEWLVDLAAKLDALER